jgi:TRAP-type uncharacterized transport system substrate-binding protein
LIVRIPKITRVSWRDLAVTVGPFVVLLVIAFWIAARYVHPAPPSAITLAAGPKDSSFDRFAQRYAKILARQGVTLKVLPTEGALDNLKRLADPKVDVDVGFVQGGLATLGGDASSELMSLGSIFYLPVYVFYRAPQPIARLSQLSGKRIAVGRQGSGTRVLAEALLKANGVEAKPPTAFLDLVGKDAGDALVAARADAVFLMGDSAPFASVRDLLHAAGVRMFDFPQSDAYVRRFRYLRKIDLPEGAYDLGNDLPARTLTLIAPTVEIVARPELHPAISDMLIEAAREVHGRANLYQQAGEFPAPLEHEYRISDDATRYYKSGKTFAYKHLPFWLASLVDRLVVVLVPILVLLIPGLKVVPALYRWRISQRIYRRYGELMALERAVIQSEPAERPELVKRLDKIEERVIGLKLPGSFADQVYILRQHINFVRARLGAQPAPTELPAASRPGTAAR